MSQEQHKPSEDIEALRRALDDSQSLFMALLLVGDEPGAWKTEGFAQQIIDQANANRRLLGPPK